MRLNEDEVQLVENLTMQNVKPRNVLTALKKENPENVSTLQTIYNVRTKFRLSTKAGKTPMQLLISFLQQEDYIYVPRTNKKTNELEDLFFAHPKALDLWRVFPHVLLMDATYKTNRYKLPLLEIVGVTSTNMTFCIAFVYIHNETESTYTWALNCLKSTIDGCISPRVIVTYKDKSVMNACRKLFSGAKKLLCRWHINQCVIKNYKPSIKCEASWNSVFGRWNSLILSKTKETYMPNYARLEARLDEYQDVLAYLNDTWLDPHKEMFVSVWTDQFLNFGNHTTNRVESQHAKLKKYLETPHADLETISHCIHQLIETQLTSIKASFEQSQNVIKHIYNIPLFQNLCGFVSLHALDLMYDEFKRSESVGVFTENCGCHLHTCYGLLCAHEHALYSSECRSILLSSIDSFWKKLDLSPCISLESDDIGCEEEVQRFTDTFKKESTPGKFSLLRKIRNIITHPTSLICEHAVQNKTRSRPPLKNKVVKKTVVDMPPQQPLTRSYSSASTSFDSNVFGYQEPPRHISYTQQSPKYSFPFKLPRLFHPYITHVQDVPSDGNCGFSAIFVCLGGDQKEWPIVRMDLINELVMYKEEYEIMFGKRVWVATYNRLNFFRKDMDAPPQHWMIMPEMGILIASKYNVILHVLSMDQDVTYLPLRSEAPPWHQHRIITIAHVNDNHFVKVILSGGYPMHTIIAYWNARRGNCSSGWATPYQVRFNMYQQHLRSKYNPESIILEV